jgi:enamine deaminase RidA (YjgF/YER057c/UK114 family)
VASADERLEEMGVELPEPPSAAGAYLQAKRDGDTLYLAGHGPFDPRSASFVTGKVGADVTPAQAYEAAWLTGLQMLATTRAALGSLAAVRSVVKVFGMVNCAPGFNLTPRIIDGCSELLVAVFGDEVGGHARSAVGMAELPFDIAVEIEAVVSVR